MTWKILSQTVTSQGFPREFAINMGKLYPSRWHCIAAERTGGGNDDVIPRRVMGVGTDRHYARSSLEETIATYDPSYKIVPARA